MNHFTDYLASGHAWLYVPVAILLGALHGLEPGHSKTMMAAFIIAVRGTIAQAVLLGLSAAVSHSLIIWVLAALALHYGSRWDAETLEPWLQIGSAVLILGLALWMYVRTRREVAEAEAHHEAHSHAPTNTDPGLLQHDVALPAGLVAPARIAALAKGPRRGAHGGIMLDTGHGWLEVEIFTQGAAPRFRIYYCKPDGTALPLPRNTRVGLETLRLDGSSQTFVFEPMPAQGCWEATAVLPEPHEFQAIVTLSHGDHAHTYQLRFGGDKPSEAVIAEELKPLEPVFQDAHERYHAEDIARRFTNRHVTTSQIVLFGITGGLMPCPAAFTILLVCLQLKRATLGFAIVGAFSFGLALTMVTVGTAAAWSVQHAQKRFSGFGESMRKAPYVSCVLLGVLALYMAWTGWQGLHAPHH